MQIKEIMTRKVDWADPATTVQELAKRMRDEDLGAVPIAENERLIGMVTDRDIVVRGLAGNAKLEQVTARDVMTDQLLWCFDNQSAEEVLTSMGEQRIRRLPVVDRDKQLVGMVSLGDLAQHVKSSKSGEALKAISA